MTLKELLLKYEFDTIVPDLLTVDEPIKDNLYAFKEAYDTLRRMAPGDAQGEQIVVSLEVETEEDGAEIERYLYASNCEGDLCESSLAKEVVIEFEPWRRSFGILPSLDSCQSTKGMFVNCIADKFEFFYEDASVSGPHFRTETGYDIPVKPYPVVQFR